MFENDNLTTLDWRRDFVFYINGFELYDYSLLIPIIILGVVGIYDDIHSVDFKLKFIFQVIAAKIIIDNGLIIDNFHGMFGLYEINRVLARTADRYLNDSMEGNLNVFSWLPDSLPSSTTSPLNSFNLYHNRQNVIFDSILDSSGHMGSSMAENYMNKVNGLINDLLMNLNQPKVINFDKLLYVLDEELHSVGLKSEYNIAISNISNKVIYFKEPETLTTTVMYGYKSPIILS